MDQKIWMKKVPTHPSRDLEGWGAGEGKGTQRKVIFSSYVRVTRPYPTHTSL